jgi:ferritin-like metal-binding protein YciE
LEAHPNGKAPMTIKTIEELFIHELSDIYSAEKQLTKSLPRMARASTAPELKEAFTSHLEETQGQVERIDQIVELLDIASSASNVPPWKVWWKRARKSSKR